MTASNNKNGFQFPKGPSQKLDLDAALKRHHDNLAELEREMRELGSMLDELEALVSNSA